MIAVAEIFRLPPAIVIWCGKNLLSIAKKLTEKAIIVKRDIMAKKVPRINFLKRMHTAIVLIPMLNMKVVVTVAMTRKSSVAVFGNVSNSKIMRFTTLLSLVDSGNAS